MQRKLEVKEFMEEEEHLGNGLTTSKTHLELIGEALEEEGAKCNLVNNI